MIHVLASITVNAGCLSEFVSVFKANVPNVMREKGCVEYVPTVDVATGLAPQVLDANVVTVVEKWETLDDLRAHLAAPHMLAYSERVKGLVASVSLKVLTAA